MTLDAGDEQLVDICIRVLDEVWRRLFGRDSNEGHTLVGWLEPDNLGSFDWAAARFVTSIALAFTTLSLLLLLCSSGRRPKKAKSARKQLARHPFDDGDDMSSKLGLDFVGYPKGNSQ